MFLVKPVYSRYFRKFLMTIPSAVMTKGIQIHYFLCLSSGKVMDRGNCCVYYRRCFILSHSINIISYYYLLYHEHSYRIYALGDCRLLLSFLSKHDRSCVYDSNTADTAVDSCTNVILQAMV
jgi:hypothetical protein